MDPRLTACRNLSFNIPLQTQELHRQSLGFGVPRTSHDRKVELFSCRDGHESGLRRQVEHGSGAPFIISYSWRSYWKKTLNELDDEFRAIRGLWNESNDCKALVAQMKRLAATKEEKLLLKNIVALGVGSFHLTTQKGIPQHTGFQLAAILTIRDTLKG